MKNIILAVMVAVIGAGSFAGGYFAGQKAERSQYVKSSDLPEASGCPDGMYLFSYRERDFLDIEYAWYRKEDAHRYCDFKSFERDKASGAYNPGY